MVMLELPLPPSANNLFPTNRRTGRRYCSPQYQAWKIEAGRWIQVFHPERMKGRVSIDIAVSDKARGDCANREKATVDLLVAHGVIEGDSKKFVHSVTTHWASDVHGVRVTIVPEYSASRDFSGSIEECYRAIKARKAAGGKGWPV